MKQTSLLCHSLQLQNGSTCGSAPEPQMNSDNLKSWHKSMTLGQASCCISWWYQITMHSAQYTIRNRVESAAMMAIDYDLVHAPCLVAFPPKSCKVSPYLQCVLYALSLSSSIIWSFLLYLENSTFHKVSNYAVFCSLFSFDPSFDHMFPSVILSHVSSVCVLLLMSETKLHANIQVKLRAKSHF
jgi:hypothetical protein